MNIKEDGNYETIYWRRGYKKSRWKKKAFRLAYAFCKYECGSSTIISDAQWFRVKDIISIKA